MNTVVPLAMTPVPQVLSVDVGGTKTLTGWVSAHGHVSGEASQPTRVGGDDGERVAQRVADLCDGLLPAAVVLGFPEYVSSDGRLTSAEVLTWAEQPASRVSVLVPALAGRVVVESDVRLGAWGELAFGAARGTSSALYVSLGTGLSCALTVGDEVWSGHRGEAIALGEWPAPEGNLESYVSGAGVARRYAQMVPPRADGLPYTGRDVVEAAARGHADALRVLESAGDALGGALAAAVAVFDPEVVVVGGGWGTARTPLVVATQARYRSEAARRPGAAPLVTATCGPKSGLMGGAALAAARGYLATSVVSKL